MYFTYGILSLWDIANFCLIVSDPENCVDSKGFFAIGYKIRSYDKCFEDSGEV